jgi:CheY-like chemotaxis protein
MAARSADPPPTLDPRIAHDVRSIVNSLLLAVELLESGDEACRQDATTVVRRKAETLSDLIDELSGTTRLPRAPGAIARPRPGTRVLVVEDEYLLAQAVARQLAQAGCEVVGPVGSVDDTLELLPAHELDCAIVDANLDGQFSSPVVRALAARGVPAAIVSGYDHAAIPADCRDLPFLQKPVDTPDLLRLVAGLCREPAGQ